ncbi:hypothetical protein POX_c04708 [Penicillium oxalicum]|uniref:hypothetical protein n=1 Tax=Penicillium oxalicum TaxID=69781 RepID=UPI0020B6A68F|nr:hypothetical protein POX_c04708 [Penicillium oxalicum]KAI2791829.1 hypothetical protein POX_c04708 [Penicillium oxalicum]
MTTAHRPPMAQILGPKPISRLSEEEGTAILETQDAIAQGFNTVLGRRDKPQTLDDSIWAPKGAKSDAPSNRQQKGTSDSYKTGVYEAAQAIHNKIQRGPGNCHPERPDSSRGYHGQVYPQHGTFTGNRVPFIQDSFTVDMLLPEKKPVRTVNQTCSWNIPGNKERVHKDSVLDGSGEGSLRLGASKHMQTYLNPEPTCFVPGRGFSHDTGILASEITEKSGNG